ncbi:unnamed protein product [Meloidogyne enterolobii]|uniref:Uncharacterized protein n=1 Tax=Meloidogyne enterolobii TaxID=390850 RepID=A0ACB1ASF6_MELEN
MSISNNISASLLTYLQNGDICNYLNIRTTSKDDSNNLTIKLDLLDQLNNKTIFDFIFSNINHQLIVAECTYKYYLNYISTPQYNNLILNLRNMGVWSGNIFYHILPAIFAFISILLNISLIIVSFKKLKVILFYKDLVTDIDKIRKSVDIRQTD